MRVFVCMRVVDAHCRGWQVDTWSFARTQKLSPLLYIATLIIIQCTCVKVTSDLEFTE